MKIKVTEFGERHFSKTFGGTKILDRTIEDFQHHVNFHADALYDDSKTDPDFKVMDGYAPFCKLVAMRNFTDARVGSMPITLENYQYLRSGYSARRKEELPVFSRWLELPLGKPKAEWLVLVLYDKAQLDKEGRITYEKELKKYNSNYHTTLVPEVPTKPESFDADWGIVAILGQNSCEEEEPMQPATMIRNTLGIEEGGSGVALDREAYIKSCDFWDKHAIVK